MINKWVGESESAVNGFTFGRRVWVWSAELWALGYFTHAL
jgi:hypothetical protein